MSIVVTFGDSWDCVVILQSSKRFGKEKFMEVTGMWKKDDSYCLGRKVSLVSNNADQKANNAWEQNLLLGHGILGQINVKFSDLCFQNWKEVLLIWKFFWFGINIWKLVVSLFTYWTLWLEIIFIFFCD